ncbi:C39 family peptidase [Jonesiaceae bacterium BS-20]|uniref:C39 family peptidase n=1 Tax=Jonesiaceae bacterium BS-20 TaxID=3120821 RepID=A0AAU7E1C8_9MICO
MASSIEVPAEVLNPASLDLPSIPNAGPSVENDDSGDALLAELLEIGSRSNLLGVSEAIDLQTYPGGLTGQPQVAPAVFGLPPVGKSLSLTWAKQINGYYCGPASAYMVLNHLGVKKSKDGKNTTLTQANLAGSNYLGTTSNAGTPWASKKMHATLNKWTGTTDWAATNAPSTDGQKLVATAGAFVRNIGQKNRAMLMGTVEMGGQAHYNNHPKAKTIGHWLVGYGYTPTGFRMADPAAGITNYTNSAQKFFMTGPSWAPFVRNGIVA